MSNRRHHPRTETLAAYAAGALDEARSVVIATHVSTCDECKTAIRDFEALGGVAIEHEEPVALRNSSMESFWARAGAQDIRVTPPSTRPANDLEPAAVQPLSAYLKGGIDNVDWRPVAPGIHQHIIKAKGYRNDSLRLLKIAPGVTLPTHTHGDNELTMILRGAYEDELGSFGPGDLADLDEEFDHAPKAVGDEPCICLIATSAPLRFKTIIGKAMQPFHGL